MPVPQCFELMQIGEAMLASNREFQRTLVELLERDAPAKEFAEAFASRVSERQAALVREEFELLPVWTLKMIAENWLIAHDAGKRFELRNTRPKDVMAAARSRRVELCVALEEHRVVVELSHVPGRHGTWYQVSAALVR